MSKKENTFSSSDNIHKIHAVWWTSDKEPVAVLQIVHGMTEFIERYDEFARYMTDKGIVVVGHDHLGHGKSVNNSSEWGYFSKDNSDKNVIMDIHRLMKITKKKYPDVPYYVLGHSMGSFFVRRYACHYSEEIDGIIVMGTAQLPSILRMAGKIILSINSAVYGDNHRSNFTDMVMFGNYNNRVESPRTVYDWLTKDEKIVDNFIKEPACTFKFTNNGFKTMIKTLDFVQNQRNVDKIRKDMAVLVAAGDADPVGNYGKGVKKAYNMYKKAGVSDITLKMFEGDRHELINEIDRMDVYDFIYEWIKNRI